MARPFGRLLHLPATVAAVVVLVLSAASARAEGRWALVIGVSRYVDESIPDLSNTINDARTVSSALYNMGFEVYHLEDATKVEVTQAVDRIAAEQGGSDLGLLYYAGHGLQIKGTNYALPSDISPGGADFLSEQSISIGDLIGRLSDVGIANLVVILDSCRNSPFDDQSATGTGLALVDAPGNTIIAYSTAPGAVALDGDGAHSPYTAALASVLEEPEQDIRDVLRLVRIRVRLATGGAQTPWYIDNSPDEIVIQSRRTARGESPLASPAGGEVSVAATAWRTIADSSDPRDFELFAKLFPESDLAGQARRQLTLLGEEGGPDFPLMDLGLPDTDPEVPEGLGSIVTACDVLATGIGDVLAVADPVPHDLVNTRAALRACIEAVAADPDNPRLLGLLGRVLRLEERYDESLHYFGRAADLGSPTAHGAIASAYRQGWGVEVDYPRAAEAAREAALLGSAPMRLFMGIFYREGWGVPQSFGESRRWIRLAADSGYAPALVAYGDFHRRGQGVAQDPAAAVPYYEKAASLGSTDAMNLLGLAHLRGEGAPRDVERGVEWLSRASENGNPYAAFHLGRAFLSGEGVERDVSQALAYFRLSSQRNYLGGYLAIGDVLAEGGGGVEPDRPEAYANYVIAREAAVARDTIDAREEFAEVEAKLAALAARMTPEEVAAGEARASGWIEQYGLLDFNLVNE